MVDDAGVTPLMILCSGCPSMLDCSVWLMHTLLQTANKPDNLGKKALDYYNENCAPTNTIGYRKLVKATSVEVSEMT